MAVNDKTGVIVQVSKVGFTGMLNVAQKSMKLYFMRNTPRETEGLNGRSRRQVDVIEDLEKQLADSESGKLIAATEYQHVCGATPAATGAGGDRALDAVEEIVYLRVGKEEVSQHLPEGTKISANEYLHHTCTRSMVEKEVLSIVSVAYIQPLYPGLWF